MRARQPRQNYAVLLLVANRDPCLSLREERDGLVERLALKELRDIITERNAYEAFCVVRPARLLGSHKVVRCGAESPHFGESFGKPKPRGKRFDAPLRPFRKPLGEGERVRE